MSGLKFNAVILIMILLISSCSSSKKISKHKLNSNSFQKLPAYNNQHGVYVITDKKTILINDKSKKDSIKVKKIKKHTF